MRRTVIDIAPAALAKLLAVVVLAWLWLQLWELLMLVVVGVVLAITLEPIVHWLQEHRFPRGLAAFLCVLALALLIVGFFWIAGASLAEQAKTLGERIAEVQRAALSAVPDWIARPVKQQGSAGQGTELTLSVLKAGRLALTALAGAAIALILAVYLIIEGRQTYVWLAAYAPPGKRERVHRTALEARKAIFSYAVGNAATSAFATIVMFVALLLLHVPAALLLALLAGLFDFVPVVGLFCAAIPGILLALTRSVGIAVAVAFVYAAEHAVENYYIAPRVYGDRLKLSNVAVILALAVGAEIGGVVGAVLALPFAALYPVIENVWLKDYLSRSTTEVHRRLEDQA